MLKRHYDPAALLCNTVARGKLVDTLYHLNDVPFELGNQVRRLNCQQSHPYC